jgi:hypothetical protein
MLTKARVAMTLGLQLDEHANVEVDTKYNLTVCWGHQVEADDAQDHRYERVEAREGVNLSKRTRSRSARCSLSDKTTVQRSGARNYRPIATTDIVPALRRHTTRSQG